MPGRGVAAHTVTKGPRRSPMRPRAAVPGGGQGHDGRRGEAADGPWLPALCPPVNKGLGAKFWGHGGRRRYRRTRAEGGALGQGPQQAPQRGPQAGQGVFHLGLDPGEQEHRCRSARRCGCARLSAILLLGSFRGGAFKLHGGPGLDSPGKILVFPAHLEHGSEPFTGERFSVVFFSRGRGDDFGEMEHYLTFFIETH